MPRVSQEHLDARRQQILDAARACFAREGFHATSMQDILSEAGLSAGATYRYFGSKEEIIGAIAQDILGHLATAFEGSTDAADPPPLAEVFRGVARRFEELDAEHDTAKMVLSIWAEAVRTPAVREQLLGVVSTIRSRCTQLIVTYQRRGEIGPGEPADLAKVLMSFWPGFVLQRAVIGDVDADEFATGLRSVLREGKVTRK